MSRFRRYRPSGSMLVALFALVMATTGSAVAASLITSAQIKDGTIQTKDISKKARTQLNGKRGPVGPKGAAGPAGQAGSQGAAGAKGDPGAAGGRGPSNGFVSFKDGPVSLAFSSSVFTTIASLSLPAGSFVISGKTGITNNAGIGNTIARCRLVSPAGDFDEGLAALEDVNTSGSANAGVISLAVGSTLASAGNVTLQCRNEGTGISNARFIKLSAIQVETLSNTASP